MYLYDFSITIAYVECGRRGVMMSVSGFGKKDVAFYKNSVKWP